MHFSTFPDRPWRVTGSMDRRQSSVCNHHGIFRRRSRPRLAVLRDDHLLEVILSASPDLIYVYDRLEERYLFVSERSTPMLGYTPQQIMQLESADIHELIHPEDLRTPRPTTPNRSSSPTQRSR